MKNNHHLYNHFCFYYALMATITVYYHSQQISKEIMIIKSFLTIYFVYFIMTRQEIFLKRMDVLNIVYYILLENLKSLGVLIEFY